MHTTEAKLGWIMALAGSVLLLLTGKVGLVVILLPAAVLLALAVLGMGHYDSRRDKRIKIGASSE